MSLMLWLYIHVYLLYNRSYINFKNNKHVAEKGGFEPPEPPLDPALVIDSTVEPAGVNFANNGAGADLFPTNLGLTENHIPSQPVLQNYPLTSFSGNT